MSLSIITTVRHNIGDDFVREGILYLLKCLGSERKIELIHKHSPITVNYGFESLRSARLSKKIDPILQRLRVNNRIDSAEVLIQSGAPIYWCHQGEAHCCENEWFDPLIRRRYLVRRKGKKFLNIAGGSCQEYYSNGQEIARCPKCLTYIKELYECCDLTLLRDNLAARMLKIATGVDAKVLPCTSIFARDKLNISPSVGEYIVLNVMENGGHFKFSQDINSLKWRENFRKIAAEVRKYGRVVVACHNQVEENLAKELVPDLERFLVPNQYIEFMNFYSRAKWGVLNRVHGAFMMASFGKPAVVIGTDSRARMIENLGLPSYFVEDISVNEIDEIVNLLSERSNSYSEEIDNIRREAKISYLFEMQSAMDRD